jgi:hypothetical protein
MIWNSDGGPGGTGKSLLIDQCLLELKHLVSLQAH